MIEIREMQPGDLQEVAAIEQECFTSPWSRQGFEDALLQENTTYIVASWDGKIVGYCGMMTVLDEGDITNVAVDKEYRGKRIAQKMLEELLLKGAEKEICRFTLEVRVSNKAALHLYEKLGFRTAGIRKNFYEKPSEDAAIMWKQ